MNPLIPIGAVAAGLALLAGCHHQPPAPKAEPPAAVAKRQHQLDTRVQAIGARADAVAARAIATSEDAAHAAEAAPDGQTPVPDDVLAAWGPTIDRLRADAARDHAASGADDPGAAAPAGSLPTP